MGGWSGEERGGWVVGTDKNKANSAPIELGLGLSLVERTYIGFRTKNKCDSSEVW